MLKKIGTLIFVSAFLLMLVRPLSASAETAPDIWVDAYSGILDLTTLQYTYQNLSPGQKDICNYLVGMCNYMYLDARGFSFSDGALGSQNAFIAKMISIGAKILYMDSGLSGWGSRFNPILQNYVSACVNYAYDQVENITFNTWYQNLDSSFVLPYTAELLDAWSLWYDDNSIEGISTFGEVESPWNSGEYKSFPYDGVSFASAVNQTEYNNFFLNYSPVIFSNEFSNKTYMAGFAGVDPPNTLIILRASTYDSFRYGRYDGTTLSKLTSDDTHYEAELYNHGSYIKFQNVINVNYYWDVLRASYFNAATNNIGDFIDVVFRMFAPLGAYRSSGYYFGNCYPFITHVFLVDDLNTLSNPEELFNVDDLDIDGGSPQIKKPINKYWWVFKDIDDNFPYPVDPVRDNLVDDNGDPVTDPPMTTSIVNNNTVNNYYITNGEPITVPVNWFSRAESYVSYLWSMTEPLVLYARDLLDCMTFFDDGILSNVKGPGPAIFGICVIGVAGGIVSKLLL